jgi:aldehyde dehydrogenase (NAD+)
MTVPFLKELKGYIKAHRKDFYRALREDLGKSQTESRYTEVGIVLEELSYAICHLSRWQKPKKVPTPLRYFSTKTYIHREPHGKVLIFSPWNYPFQLALLPLIGAISGGNTPTLKLSEMTPHVNEALKKMEARLGQGVFTLVEGGPARAVELLEEKWDYIFFTGSSRVGRSVYKKAAMNLTPVTLELGGKSPCILDLTDPKSLTVACRRILWGKLVNCGQTCIAPDYLLVRDELKDRVIKEFKTALRDFYPKGPQKSPDYGRLISQAQGERLLKLLDHQTLILGGGVDLEARYFEPTLVDEPAWESPLMEEEIFGPILPIISFKSHDDVLEKIKSRDKPLAFYLYSKDPKLWDFYRKGLSFGGGVINDTLIQGGTPYAPFGGVGASGLGAYRGQKSFETFTREKTLMVARLSVDPWIRYPPYGFLKRWLLSWFL